MAGSRLIVPERLVISERLTQGGVPDVIPSNGWFGNTSGGAGSTSTNTVVIAGLDSGVSITITAYNDNAQIIEEIIVNSVSQGNSAVVDNGDSVYINYSVFGSGTITGTTTVRNASNGNALLNTHTVSITGGGL